jgi:predicted DCC family thiol-disulfide oxidoreductase YuxK
MTEEAADRTGPVISTWNEGPLHAALKAWYAQPGDACEVPVDGFVIDIVRGDLLVEIQTRGFTALKDKLATLIRAHPVRLVYPIAREKWIVKLADDGEKQLSRRKSPKHGSVEQIFDELVSIPHLLAQPNFTFEVIFIHEEEVRRHDARRGWRRKGWVTHERRLVKVVGQQQFTSPEDVRALIPAALAEPFTSADLAHLIPGGLRRAYKMIYCLRAMNLLTQVGKRGRAALYRQTRSNDAEL